jgi:hypothetical protein
MNLYSRGKCGSKALAIMLAFAAAIALTSAVGNAQKASKKLSEQNVIDLLTGDVSSADVATEARKDGISFQVTATAEKDIRAAGGTDELVRVLKSLAPRAPAPAPTPTPHPTPPAAAPVLLIQSTPGQCEVYVDDEPVGSTSQQGRLKLTRISAGEHSVRVSLSGYQDYEQTVTLSAGQTSTVPAQLEQAAVKQIAPPPPNPQPEPQVSSGQAGWLGVLALQQQPSGAQGVVLSGAQPGSPADQAGLKTYDTILAVNGQQVTTPVALRQAVAGHQAGEVVQVTWNNGSTTVTRPIRLAATPAGGGKYGGQNQVQPNPVPTPTPSPRPSLNQFPHNGMVSFYVGHDHGPNGQGGNNYCVGTMSIGNGMISYQGQKGTNGVHNFEIPLSTVREAKRNNVYLSQIGAFHIRTKKNTNFNFVALNQQGQYQPPDTVLTAIDNAMGK